MSATRRRLAELADRQVVKDGEEPGANIPVAPPSVLARLVKAFEAVHAGKVAATPGDPGQVIYKVDDFSFRMRAPKSP